MNTLSSFDAFSAAKTYFEERFDTVLPSPEIASVDFSCAEDTSSMTFDLTKESDFTEEEYVQFVRVLSEKLGDGTDKSDEYQKKTTWTVDGGMWDVVWDLESTLAVNFGEVM